MSGSSKPKRRTPELKVLWNLLEFLDEKLVGLDYDIWLNCRYVQKSLNIYVGPLGEAFER